MNRLRFVCFGRWLMVVLLFCGYTVKAQKIQLDPVSNTIAIKNATIIQAPGRSIANGTIVFENGVITAVGQNVSIPSQAQVIEADSLYIYAGFISGLSHIGVNSPKEEKSKSKPKNPGDPPNDKAGIQPEINPINLIDPKHKSIKEFRKLGFTAAVVAPHGQMLPGSAALITLGGAKPDEMVFKSKIALFGQLKGVPKRIYPNTIIGVMAKYRELYRQSMQAKANASAYAKNPSGLERPEVNRVYEAFYPVIDKKIPVLFQAPKVLDIQRVMTLKKELGFNLMLGEVKQAWDLVDKLKQSETSIFLSLDLPEIEEDKKDSTNTDESAKKSEVDFERERLAKRKKEMIAKYYRQPSLLKSKGINFGFSTTEVKPKDIKKNLMELMKNGFTKDEILAALTTQPAAILGVSSSMGTLDKGKMANLIVSRKPYFDEKSEVQYVFVDGKMYKAASEAKKDDKKKGKEKNGR